LSVLKDLSFTSKSERGIFFLRIYVVAEAFIGMMVGAAIGLSLLDHLSHKSIVERILDQYWVPGLPGLAGGAVAAGMVARSLAKRCYATDQWKVAVTFELLPIVVKLT
jgi:hypothetical protein